MASSLEQINIYKEFTTNHKNGNTKKENLNHRGHGVTRSFKINLVFLRETLCTPWLYWE
jgi:hypothetical protein